MDDLLNKLTTLNLKRDKLDKAVQELRVKREVSIRERDQIRANCINNGIDPDKLDELISSLESRLQNEVRDYENSLQEVEEKLKKYRSGN